MCVMCLGFILIGMVFGLITAIVTLLSGAGLAMAALVYGVSGLLGVGLGLAMTLWRRSPKNTDQDASTRVNALHNPK